MQIEWKGIDEEEKGYCSKTGKLLVNVNPQFFRPAEVDLLIGNSQKAKDLLGWEAKTTLKTLCEDMIFNDIKRNKNGFSF